MKAIVLNQSNAKEQERKISVKGRVLPADVIRLSDAQLRWPHWIYQWLCTKLLKLCFQSRYTLRVEGHCHVPREWQPCVIVCNHSSLMDPPLISIALDYRPIVYMAKIELFIHPLMRAYMWAMSSFAVNREKLDVSTVKSAMKALKHGKWALAVFPEGTRQGDGSMGASKKGAAYFAKAAKVPVLPIAIVHSTEKNGRKCINVRIGPMFPYESDVDALADRIQDAITGLATEIRSDLERLQD